MLISTTIPFALIEIIDEFWQISPLFQIYGFLMARFCSLFNPVFYAVFNNKFMFAYHNVLNVILKRRRLKFKEYDEEYKKKMKLKTKQKVNEFLKKNPKVLIKPKYHV